MNPALAKKAIYADLNKQIDALAQRVEEINEVKRDLGKEIYELCDHTKEDGTSAVDSFIYHVCSICGETW